MVALIIEWKKRSWIPSLIVFIALMCFGSFRHLGEVAFFFAGYEMGKHVKDGKIVNMIYWVLLPVVLYAVCHVISSLYWVPRSLWLVIPFLLLAAKCFDKMGQALKKPFTFMGKISLESYMANVMLPAVFAFVPWVVLIIMMGIEHCIFVWLCLGFYWLI